MRIPYIDNPPAYEDPKDQAILQRVLQRRGDRGLIPLDRALLHSPPVADGWNSFLGSIRSKTTLSDSLREAAICRVASLNHAWFEWEAHAPILQRAGEVAEAGVRHILKAPPHATDAGAPVGCGLDEKHLAVLAYTDAMTREVEVPDRVFERLRASFDHREVVEITATVAAYNCVSRFLVALDVAERNGQRKPA